MLLLVLGGRGRGGSSNSISSITAYAVPFYSLCVSLHGHVPVSTRACIAWDFVRTPRGAAQVCVRTTGQHALTWSPIVLPVHVSPLKSVSTNSKNGPASGFSASAGPQQTAPSIVIRLRTSLEMAPA